MRTIILPYYHGHTIQVVIEKIEGRHYDPLNGVINLGTGGSPITYSILVTDDIDAAAMLQQIGNAIVSTAESTVITGDPAPSSAPANVVLFSDYGQNKLNWDALPSNYSYKVYRSTVSGGGYTYIGQTNTSSFVDTNIQQGIVYYYVVTSFVPRGTSAYSNEVFGAGLVPTTPAGLGAVADFYQSDLSWTAITVGISTDFTSTDISYRIYRDGNLVATVKTISCKDANLVAGQIYSYTIAAVINNYVSPQSAPVNCTPIALPAPATLIASAGIYSANLSWSPVVGSASYTIKRSIVSGAGYVIIGTETIPSFNDTRLRSDTIYYYIVTANVNGGESAASNESSCQPNPVTINSASPNPASINGSVITFTGIGFDQSQQALLKYGSVALQVAYVDSNNFMVTTPVGIPAGNIQFLYNVNGSDYVLPFFVAFQ
jgi:fibronectin type 3 domain-containing protein